MKALIRIAMVVSAFLFVGCGSDPTSVGALGGGSAAPTGSGGALGSGGPISMPSDARAEAPCTTGTLNRGWSTTATRPGPAPWLTLKSGAC